MGKDFEQYTSYLTDLYQFYQNIHDYVLLDFNVKDDKSVLDIDFSEDFVVSNGIQSNFIMYDRNTKKYNLSLYYGIRKYYLLKNCKVSQYNGYTYKSKKLYLNYFSDDERCLIMQNNKISFMDMIKSEFLHEYISSLIDIVSGVDYTFSDQYDSYAEKNGAFYNEIVVEFLTRKFAFKHNLFYLPLSIGDDKIFSVTNRIFNNSKNKEVILNSNMDALLNQLNRVQAKSIVEYEERCFEEKYNLKKNSFEDNRKDALFSKTIDSKKEELKNILKNLKTTFDISDNNSNNLSDW